MEPPRDLFASLELLGGLCVFGIILCAGSLIAGPILLLLARRDRGLRRAASGWPAVTGQVVEVRVVRTRGYHYGFTLQEAEARVRQQVALPVGGPERVLSIALGLLDDPLEFAAEQVLPAQVEQDDWPLIVYTYTV